MYKVVCEIHGPKLISATLFGPSAYCHIYYLDKWIRPKNPNSKLFIFDALKCAKIFLKERLWRRQNGSIPDYNYHLYECEAENPIKAHAVAHNNFDEFWNREIKGEPSHWTYPPPNGTLACDAVKLTKKITT